MRLGISLACETSIRREVRECCSFPLRSNVRSKRIELSFLPRNLLHTLTVRNPEFPFSEFGERGARKSVASEVRQLCGAPRVAWRPFGKTKRIVRPTPGGDSTAAPTCIGKNEQRRGNPPIPRVFRAGAHSQGDCSSACVHGVGTVARWLHHEKAGRRPYASSGVRSVDAAGRLGTPLDHGRTGLASRDRCSVCRRNESLDCDVASRPAQDGLGLTTLNPSPHLPRATSPFFFSETPIVSLCLSLIESESLSRTARRAPQARMPR